MKQRSGEDSLDYETRVFIAWGWRLTGVFALVLLIMLWAGGWSIDIHSGLYIALNIVGIAGACVAFEAIMFTLVYFMFKD